MRPFDDIAQDQPHAVACLQRACARQRLPHAIIIASPGDVGEDELTQRLAQTLLCERPHAPFAPCGQCCACDAVARGIHADLHVVRPKGLLRAIKTEDMLDLIQALQSTTLGGGAKVAVIYQAETLRKESANRFLKTLEEPTADTYFVLLTTRPERLLPTIQSRCQMMRLRPLSATRVRARIAALPAASPAAADLACAIARGRWNRAAALLEQYDSYRALVEALLALLANRTAAALPAVDFGKAFSGALKEARDDYEAHVKEALAAQAERCKDFEASVRREVLAAAEDELEAAQAARERDIKAGLFETLLDLWRDVWIYQETHTSDCLLHRAYQPQIARLAQLYSSHEIARNIREIETLRGPTVFLNTRVDIVVQGLLAGATAPVRDHVPLQRALMATGL
jgi:DNA polymerase III delta' subunit